MNPLHKEILGEALERAVGNTPVAAKHVMKLVKEFQQALKEHEAQMKEQGKTTKEIEAHAKELQKTIKTYDKILEQAGEALSQIKQLKQGDPGRDADEEAIVQKVLRAIPKPQDGKDGVTPAFEAIVAAILKRMPEQKPAKDGKSVKVEDIIKELKKSLTVKDIPGLENELAAQRSQLAGKIYGKDTWARGGGDTVAAGTNVTITTNADGAKVINASGGGGAVESVTGLNTDNTDPANPVVQISVDGVTITGAGTPGSPLVAATGGSGDVTGPASSTDNAIVRFDGLTGKIIQDYTSGAPTISDTGAVNIPLSTGNALVVDTDTFVVDTTNERVGINTASPTVSLDVVGQVRQYFNGVMIADTPLENATFHGFEVRNVGLSVASLAANTSGEVRIGAIRASYYPTFYSNNLEAMRISTAGFVGIGSTNPQGMLTVGGTQTGNAGLEVVPGSGIVIQAYNRTSSAYSSLSFDGSSMAFRTAGTSGTLHTFRQLTTTLAGTTVGAAFDYSTSVTNAASNMTGIALTTAAVTAASTNTLRGLTITPGAITNAAGTSTYIGALITMPAITQTAGTLTSTGLRINGGTVTSGTAYALITDSTAGNVGIGETAPASLFSVGSGSLFRVGSDGRVGIKGAPSATFGLKVYGTGTEDGIDIVLDSASSNNGILIRGQSSVLTHNFFIASGNTGSLIMYDAGVSTLSMNAGGVSYFNGGSVGIRNTSPVALLTLGTAGTTAGTLSLAGGTSGTITLQTAAAAGTYTLTLPTSDGNSGEVLTTDGSGVLSWGTPAAAGLTVGTSTITSGTNTRILYNNAGVLGEYVTASAATASAVAQRDASGNIFFNNYAANSASTASAGSTTVLTVASARNQSLTGASNQTFQLPDATTLTLGKWFEFNNNSSGSLIITNNGGSTLYTLPAGGSVEVSTTSISTANGTWDFHALTPLAVTWSSGASGLIFNTVLSTTPQIHPGASSATAPAFVPQRAASTTGFGGDGTNLHAIIAGATSTTFNSTGLSVGTSGVITTGTIELGAASDTTIARSAAGVIAVEGVVIPSISSTNTLTNKRVTRRLTTTNAPGATPTTNTDNVDIMNFTGLNTAITSMTTNLSGTPNDGDLLEFRFLDDGTARAITWGATFAPTTVTLPTTTVISTCLRVLFEWRAASSKWECVATC